MMRKSITPIPVAESTAPYRADAREEKQDEKRVA
jgi:hypothetical protein